jgi:hypothetical protein
MLHHHDEQPADWAFDNEVDRLFGLHDDKGIDSASHCDVEDLIPVASSLQQRRGKRKRTLDDDDDAETSAQSPSSSVSTSPPSPAVPSSFLSSSGSTAGSVSATLPRALHPLFSSAAKPRSTAAGGTMEASPVSATAASASITGAPSILSAAQLESLVRPPSYFPLQKMSDFNQLC